MIDLINNITMGKYIQYKRFNDVFNPNQIDEMLKRFIKDDWEIIHYSEKHIGKINNTSEQVHDPINEERYLVTIICGKLNKGNKQVL